MKVIKNASQYQARGQFRPWLLTISRTTALNVLRSKKEWLKEFNDMTFDADDDGAGGNHGTPSSESDDGSGRNASDALVAQADRDELRAAIDSLPELQRTAISLRWIEELSYEETAQAMKITVANAKTLLHRGRQNLENHIRSSRSKSKDRLS